MSERLERLSEMDSGITEGIKLMSFTKTLSGDDAADIRDKIAELRRMCAETGRESAALREELAQPKTPTGWHRTVPAALAVIAFGILGGVVVSACLF